MASVGRPLAHLLVDEVLLPLCVEHVHLQVPVHILPAELEELLVVLYPGVDSPVLIGLPSDEDFGVRERGCLDAPPPRVSTAGGASR